MRSVRILLLALGALAVISLALACGGDDEESGAGGATTAAPTDLEKAKDAVSAMISAAEGGDLVAAEEALTEGDPALHAVIDSLESENADLAADLDEAVEDAEKDLDTGEEAEHIVEIGNEILGLLEQVD